MSSNMRVANNTGNFVSLVKFSFIEETSGIIFKEDNDTCVEAVFIKQTA
jgi:hypothetical protein